MEAAVKAEDLRELLLDKCEDFTFETVLSTDRNINLLKKAKEKGFFIRCIYVLTSDFKINVARVRMKESMGSHSVPEDSYGDLTLTKKVTVKTVIKAKNINAKKSAKSVKIKVTLKKVNNKYLKNKKVTLKFNKKTLKVKTNKKGIVTFTIKKNVYNKLKVNKNKY